MLMDLKKTVVPNDCAGEGQQQFNRSTVDKVALGQGFSEYFGFPCQSSFHQLPTITIIYHLGLVK
jgi:hypothetical protein